MPEDYREDEYEVVPLTPLRRLEERIRKVEGNRGGNDREFILDVMDLVKSNQKLVDEVVKADAALRHDLQAIPAKIDELLESWKQFLELLKKVASEDTMPQGISEKFDKLIELNEQVLEAARKTQDSMEHGKPRVPLGGTAMPPGTSKYPRIRVVR